MAKVVGLVGSASGKIGNIVYAVTNGIQVARVYQPVVSNPKSALQNIQRSKGNLAGRISSFVPKTAIMGLGSNSRRRRAEFLRGLLKSAVVGFVDGTYTAKVPDVDVVFSRGAEPLSVSYNNISTGAHHVEVTLTGAATTMSAELYNAKQTRIVVMIYNSLSQNLVEVATKIANKPAQGANATTNVEIGFTGAYTAVVYLIPMSTADGTSVSISTSLAVKDDATIAAELSVNGSAVVWAYGKSLMVGQGTYVPA